MKLKKEIVEKGGEVDFTSHYHTDTRKYIDGRLSIRKRNGKYEVYVYWFRLRKEEVLYSANNLEDAVAFVNSELERLGYEKVEKLTD